MRRKKARRRGIKEVETEEKERGKLEERRYHGRKGQDSVATYIPE